MAKKGGLKEDQDPGHCPLVYSQRHSCTLPLHFRKQPTGEDAMKSFATTLITTSIFLSGSAFAADNWANKKGVAGIGAASTLGGTQGLQLRYNLSPKAGLQTTFGVSSSGQSDDGGKTGTRQSATGIALGGHYKIIKAKTAALSLLGSFDYQTAKDAVIDAEETGTKYTDAIFGLGLQGEVWLAKKFSLHTKVGLSIDPYGAGDIGEAYTTAEAEGDAEGEGGEEASGPEYAGMDIGLGGGLLAGAGFTVWFD